jgi:signal transduction histidine kinase
VNAALRSCLQYSEIEFTTRINDTELAAIDVFWFSFCLSNIIDNSLKHGLPPVRVRAEIEGSKAKITVEDEGVEDEDAKNQSGSAELCVEDTHRGLGLGLTLVKEVIESYGGSMTVSFFPSRVTLYFRLALHRNSKALKGFKS